MSELAKKSREDMKAKAKRMASDASPGKLDASDFTPAEPLNTGSQTGMKPVSPRQFRRGGKIVQMLGKTARPNAGKMPRASGGKAVIEDYMNRDQKEANRERPGGKDHVGGMAAGGEPDGGSFVPSERFKFSPNQGGSLIKAAGAKKGGSIKGDEAQDKKTVRSMVKSEALKRAGKSAGGVLKALSPLAGGLTGLALSNLLGGKKKGDEDGPSIPIAKKGGGEAKCRGGGAYKSGGSVSDGTLEGTRPTGGRLARASGGKIPDDSWIHGGKLGHKVGSTVKLKKETQDLGFGPEAKVERIDKNSTDPYFLRYPDGTLRKTHPNQIEGDSVIRDKRATGGRTKGKTNINIVIAPQGQQPQDAAAPMMPPAMPPKPPMMPPPPAAMAPPGMPGAAPPGIPPGMPGMPGMPRKSGGRIHMTAGAGSGLGRLEKVKAQKRVYP